MKRTILIFFSFICVFTLLYLGSEMYENKFKKSIKANTNIIEELKNKVRKP